MARLFTPANTENNNEGMNDYSAIPVGDYAGMIVKSQMKKTKAGDGSYLDLQIRIIDGKYKGRILFDKLNLDNPNPVAVQIANKTMNSICQACEKVAVEDSEELHGIPMSLKVGKTKATAAYPESNKITLYGKYTGDYQPGDESTTAAGPSTAAEGKSKTPPWMKK